MPPARPAAPVGRRVLGDGGGQGGAELAPAPPREELGSHSPLAVSPVTAHTQVPMDGVWGVAFVAAALP